MKNESILREYNRWLKISSDDEIIAELLSIRDDEKKISDAFFKDMEFGTGGLRGVIGAGTNRMNVYTVKRASLGLGQYTKNKAVGAPSIVIGYDTRIKSELFAKEAANTFASLGIKAWLFSAPLPTPVLSYAVRALHCDAGVMITASHNPASYNGYKVYGCDGCQITDFAAKEIFAEIEKSDYFLSEIETREKSEVVCVPDSVYRSFLDEVSKLSVLYGDRADKNVSIVYTPLNGTGLIPVTDALKENGYTNLTVVKEQEAPDGSFPTCPYPNPEMAEALTLALGYARACNADLVLATDPDCDRVGVAVKSASDYTLLTGNEVGILLLDYVLSQKSKHGKLPKNPTILKTIVTSNLAQAIADAHNVKLINLLTGFKYIGEAIGALEADGQEDSFIFGFEESCGYLSGTHARDKDGVNAALLVAEACAFYKSKNSSLSTRLEELYQKYGYAKNSLFSYSFEGADGLAKMQSAMQVLRENKNKFCGMDVIDFCDYQNGIYGLPKSNVISVSVEHGKITVRPSGTEPKIKIYTEIRSKNKGEAEAFTNDVKGRFESFIKGF